MADRSPAHSWHGALLIDKHEGVSSFGIVEALQRQLRERFGLSRRDLPKIGHGGTLDPFATGLLIVCVGDGVKLSRYFLESEKSYSAVMRFGETTVSGDPTGEVTERSDRIPESLEQLNELAARMTAQDYLQTPPMHSAKKVGGQPLYELARKGVEIDREPKLRRLHDFRFSELTPPLARFDVRCSSGTYIRTLAQDFSRLLGTVGMLTELRRTASGRFSVSQAMSVDSIGTELRQGKAWSSLACWVDFDRLLDGHTGVEATAQEARDLRQGKQGSLFGLLSRAEPAGSSMLVIRRAGELVAVARFASGKWELERVFNSGTSFP